MERPMTEWNDDRLDEMNGLMKEGFASVDKRFDKVDERFKGVDKRFDKVDERFKGVDKRFVRFEAEMKEDFRVVNARFVDIGERMEAGFDRINGRIDRLYGVFIVTGAGVIGTLLANNVWG